MACWYVCDGCGRIAHATRGATEYLKPLDWFQRGDDDAIQDACSRECVKAIAEKSGKTGVVLPI